MANMHNSANNSLCLLFGWPLWDRIIRTFAVTFIDGRLARTRSYFQVTESREYKKHSSISKRDGNIHDD